MARQKEKKTHGNWKKPRCTISITILDPEFSPASYNIKERKENSVT
jgi:hypothetical protein